TTSLMTAVTIAPLVVADPQRAPALAAGLAVIVGVLCLLGRAARLGFLADLLSRPVLVGYLTGVAGMMIVSQLGNVTGMAVHGSGVADEVTSFVRGLPSVHPPTLILAASVLGFLLLVQRLLPSLPGPLLAVLLAAGAVWLFSLASRGIATIGPMPAGLTMPGLPALSLRDVGALVFPAVGVAVVGYADTVLTGRAFATRHSEHLDADQELFALGAVNLAAGLVSGFPVSSSGSRTAIGDAAGARSQLHALAALVVVAVVLMVGGPVISSFPRAALGALVIFAAIRLIDIAEFRRIARFRRTELVLALVTTCAVLLLGVLPGVLVAVGMSILDLLRRVSRPHDGILGYAPGVAGMHDIDDYPGSTVVPGLVVYRYDAPLCFANAEDFRRRILGALDQSPTPPSWLLLNAEAMAEVDVTAADMLLDVCDELDRRHVAFAMARVKHDLYESLRPTGLLERVGAERIFPTLPTAVEAYRATVADPAAGADQPGS
ncbi:MAG TPA: SulP family inorganic anion transporter, partial [Pseudonocardia sp.]|nr:SulP family inorganic anion transporter [Pseudonocardia sp.]